METVPDTRIMLTSDHIKRMQELRDAWAVVEAAIESPPTLEGFAAWVRAIEAFKAILNRED